MGEVRPTFKKECGILDSHVDWSDRIKVLNLLSLAFSQKCDAAVIEYTELAQSDFRDKAFSFSREMAGVFLSDGVLTEYVLESYERAYLAYCLRRVIGGPDKSRMPKWNYDDWTMNCLPLV